jgi:hypothetical protein
MEGSYDGKYIHLLVTEPEGTEDLKGTLRDGKITGDFVWTEVDNRTHPTTVAFTAIRAPPHTLDPLKPWTLSRQRSIDNYQHLAAQYSRSHRVIPFEQALSMLAETIPTEFGVPLVEIRRLARFILPRLCRVTPW